MIINGSFSSLLVFLFLFYDAREGEIAWEAF